MLEPYSVSDLEFISRQPSIRVYLNDGSAPLTYRDANGRLTGILVDLCEMIKRKTGLDFSYHPFSREQNADGKNAITVNVPDSSVRKHTSISDAFFTTTFLLYYRFDGSFKAKTDGSYKIVLPRNRQSFVDYLKGIYPRCEFVKMDTPEECIRAVGSGKADFTMLSSYLVNNICKRKDITNIAPVPSLGVAMDFSLLVEGPDAKELTRILNKGISRLDEQEKNNMMFSYALNTTPENTLRHFIKKNALMLILVSVLLMAVAGTLFYARMLAKKNAEIKKANSAKSTFLSTISHDIRTPMNAIVNIAKLAQDACGTNTTVLADLKRISTVSDFLMALLNDVLDMSSIESGKFQLHPEVYCYEEFLKYVNTIFGPLCEQKHIRFVCEIGSTDLAVFVDKIRFNQAFFNLLSNAVKFTPAGDTVTYRVTNNIVTNGFLSCVFEISDTGCGINEAFLSRMFEPFERENATRAAYQGTGLGLSITKNIISRMGGEISVKSVQGQGTSFFVRLTMPLATEKQLAASRKTDDPASSFAGARILVVEDSETNLIILTRLLVKKGIYVEAAADGKKGVRTFSESKPGHFDMILMDIRMPGMDGLEATRLIRAMDRPDAADIPILAMTADAFDNATDASKKAGMNAHLTKPIIPTLLYDTIQQYLCKRSMDRTDGKPAPH